MADSKNDKVSEGPHQDSASKVDLLKKRAVFGTVIAIGSAAAWFIGAAFIPRWWAHRLGNLIDGSIFFGSFLGFVIGFGFTFASLMILLLGWRLRNNWRRALMFVVGAIVVSAPNLATLGIVIGTGSAAHDGERILSVGGPGLRGGTLVGVVVAVIAAVALAWLKHSRDRYKGEVKQGRDREDSKN